MSARVVFPIMMFVLAVLAFGYGLWEHVWAGNVQDAADQRVSFMIDTIEQSNATRAEKDTMYFSIASGLPSAPLVWDIGLSGSHASQNPGDLCLSESQRLVCRALASSSAPTSTINAVCGACRP